MIYSILNNFSNKISKDTFYISDVKILLVHNKIDNKDVYLLILHRDIKTEKLYISKDLYDRLNNLLEAMP